MSDEQKFIFLDTDTILVWGDEDISLTPLRNYRDVTKYRINTEVHFRIKNFDFFPELKSAFQDITITIPIGFESDIATIYRPWNFFIAHDDYRIIFPSIVHDYIYTLQLLNNRDFADKLFKTNLRENGLADYQYWVMYFAVVFIAEKYESVNKTKVNFVRQKAIEVNPQIIRWL